MASAPSAREPRFGDAGPVEGGPDLAALDDLDGPLVVGERWATTTGDHPSEPVDPPAAVPAESAESAESAERPTDRAAAAGTNVPRPRRPRPGPAREPEPDQQERVNADLVDRARAGDATAFGELYDAYVGTVYSYVYYRSRDRGLAEDLTSEAFARAWRRIDTFSWQGKDIGAWFVRIARNLLLDHLKSARFRLELTTDDLVEPRVQDADPTATRVQATAESAALVAAIGQLSPEQQECITLRYFEGLSVAETALVMNRNEGAVKALTHRAVRRLGALLPGEADA